MKNKKNKNKFEDFFYKNKKNILNKWDHYFDIYERHFYKYQNKDIVLLEVGVSNGGSINMWSNYFGKNSKIYGIDIDPRCKEFEKNNVKIFIGSQSDKDFLEKVKNKIPKVDILIDDGGHYMDQQITTFKILFSHIRENGIYLCEDLHTSYWLYFGGGYKRNGTFVEYSKNFIDQLNAFHSEQKQLTPNDFTRSVDSVHYYDSVLVVHKKKKYSPKNVISGEISFNNEKIVNYRPNVKPLKEKTFNVVINKILRYFRIKSIFWK